MTDVRTLYKTAIDFEALASHDADFARIYRDAGNRMNFSNPAAFKQLTISLLKRDFNLELKLPDDRLCPPVPNRLAYVLWIQDLIDSTGASMSEKYEPGRQVIGLDIGTGSSCIYPLLSCATRPNWRFIATDIDSENFSSATANVERNDLGNSIKLHKTLTDAPIIPLDTLDIQSIDFCMTNPPFYESRESMLESAAAKSRPPFSACTGAEVEMIVTGGEVAFVNRIIEQSILLRERIQWYTAMLGNLESVHKIIEILNSRGFSDTAEGKPGTANWAVKEFVRGTKTRRWAIAWSWGTRRPSVEVARGTAAIAKQFLPFPSLFSFEMQEAQTDKLEEKLNSVMSDLALHWKWRKQILTGVALTEKNVWSRSARRHQARAMEIDSDQEESDVPALAVKIILRTVNTGSTSIDIRWLVGRDTVLFESFCGMIKRELSKNLTS